MRVTVAMELVFALRPLEEAVEELAVHYLAHVFNNDLHAPLLEQDGVLVCPIAPLHIHPLSSGKKACEQCRGSDGTDLVRAFARADGRLDSEPKRARVEKEAAPPASGAKSLPEEGEAAPHADIIESGAEEGETTTPRLRPTRSAAAAKAKQTAPPPNNTTEEAEDTVAAVRAEGEAVYDAVRRLYTDGTPNTRLGAYARSTQFV